MNNDDPTKRPGENSGFREGQTVSRSYKVPIGLLIVQSDKSCVGEERKHVRKGKRSIVISEKDIQ